MAIRPEDVRVGKSADGVNALRGKVELVEYLGREQEAAIDDRGTARGIWLRSPEKLRARRQRRSDLAAGEVRPAAPRVRRDIMALARTDERSELDWLAILCLAPSLLYVIAMFVYPFMLRGLYQPAAAEGRRLEPEELRRVLHATPINTARSRPPSCWRCRTRSSWCRRAVSRLWHAARHLVRAHHHNHPRAADLARRRSSCRKASSASTAPMAGSTRCCSAPA